MAPCRCAPSLIQLRSEVDERWPRRDKSSDGCCGDAAHASRRSDHNPFYGYAHALDIDEDINPGANLNWLVPILMDDRRTKYVIYEGLIHYPGSRPRKYTGVNAHRQHLHVSIKTTATHDTSQWLPLPDEEDDNMTAEQQMVLADNWVRESYRIRNQRQPQVKVTTDDVNYWVGQIVGGAATYGAVRDVIVKS